MKCSKGCEGWVEKSETEKPKMITRTVTYPEPVYSPLNLGQSYYYPYLGDRHVLSIKTQWTEIEFDRVMLAHGLIYLIEEHAIQRAKAMIGEG